MIKYWILQIIACTILWIAVDVGRDEGCEIETFGRDGLVVLLLMVVAILITQYVTIKTTNKS